MNFHLTKEVGSALQPPGPALIIHFTSRLNLLFKSKFTFKNNHSNFPFLFLLVFFFSSSNRLQTFRPTHPVMPYLIINFFWSLILNSCSEDSDPLQASLPIKDKTSEMNWDVSSKEEWARTPEKTVMVKWTIKPVLATHSHSCKNTHKGTLLHALHVLFHLIFSTTPWGRHSRTPILHAEKLK